MSGQRIGVLGVAAGATAEAAIAALSATGAQALPVQASAGPEGLPADGLDVVLLLGDGLPLGDGQVHAALAAAGVPVAGADRRALVALDLWSARQALHQHNLPVPATQLLTAQSPGSAVGFPALVRPRHQEPRHPGLRVKSPGELAAAIGRLRAAGFQGDLLVERAAPGLRLCVALLHGEALPILAIPGGRRAAVARGLSETRRRGVIELARRAALSLCCGGAVLVELSLNEHDNEQVLAVDPQPHLCPRGLLAQAAARAGIGYGALLARLCREATQPGRGPVERRRAALVYTGPERRGVVGSPPGPPVT